MECHAKHTKYQPTDEEWACPTCGALGGDFAVSFFDGPVDADPDCGLLHVHDVLECLSPKCPKQDSVISGASFARLLVKKRNLVPCKACKGTGHVTRKE